MQQLLLRQVLLFSDTFVATIVVLKIVNVIAVERHSYHLSPLSITSYSFFESDGETTIQKQKYHRADGCDEQRVKIEGSQRYPARRSSPRMPPIDAPITPIKIATDIPPAAGPGIATLAIEPVKVQLYPGSDFHSCLLTRLITHLNVDLQSRAVLIWSTSGESSVPRDRLFSHQSTRGLSPQSGDLSSCRLFQLRRCVHRVCFCSSRSFSSPFASPGPNIKIDSASRMQAITAS